MAKAAHWGWRSQTKHVAYLGKSLCIQTSPPRQLAVALPAKRIWAGKHPNPISANEPFDKNDLNGYLKARLQQTAT
jgi:hypothetical protein